MAEYFVCGAVENEEGDIVNVISDSNTLYVMSSYGIDAIAGFDMKFSMINKNDLITLTEFMKGQSVIPSLYAKCENGTWLMCFGNYNNVEDYKLVDISTSKIISASTDKFDVYCFDESSPDFDDLMECAGGVVYV